MLMDSLTQMSDEHKFTAISEPDFDMASVQLPDDGPMVFEFDIEVRPEFDVPQWRGLKPPLIRNDGRKIDYLLSDLPASAANPSSPDRRDEFG